MHLLRYTCRFNLYFTSLIHELKINFNKKQGNPQPPVEHSEPDSDLKSNSQLMMLNSLKDKLCSIHERYATLTQESSQVVKDEVMSPSTASHYSQPPLHGGAVPPPQTAITEPSSSSSGIYQFFRNRSVTPIPQTSNTASSVFSIDTTKRYSWGRMVHLDIGWWVADNTGTPEPQVQSDILDRFETLLKSSEEKDKSIIVESWDDEGCPDAVAGTDAPATLAAACQVMMDYSGLENPLELLTAVLSTRHYFNQTSAIMSCNLSSVLLHQSKLIGETCDPDHRLYPSCTDVEVFILVLLTLTDAELRKLYGIDLQSNNSNSRLCSASSLKYHIAQVTRTCLHQDFENDEIMKWGSLGTLMFNILTRSDNEIPATVFRVVKVSQNVAEDHLLVSDGSNYGWAAPIRCTSNPPSEESLKSNQNSSEVTISFRITNLQAGARIPHSQSDVLIPPFSCFTIQSVEEKNSKLILVTMKWNCVPHMVGLGTRLDGMSIVEGLEMTAHSGQENTTMRLPVTKLLSELQATSSTVHSNSEISRLEELVSEEQNRSDKLRAALSEATKGYEQNEVTAHKLRQTENEHKILMNEVQRLRDDLTQESELCRELDDQRMALQNALSSKPSRVPLTELIYSSWNKLEASRRSTRELKSTLPKMDKPRDLSVILGTIEDLHEKMKWAIQSLLTPQEISACKDVTKDTKPKIQPKPADVKGRWK